MMKNEKNNFFYDDPGLKKVNLLVVLTIKLIIR